MAADTVMAARASWSAILGTTDGLTAVLVSDKIHHNRREMVTMPDTVRFPLGVSLHTLDPEQRPETVAFLAGSSVKAVELWEPDFEKGEGHVDEMRRLLAAAGVAARTVHANFGGSLDISSRDPAVRSAGIQAFSAALDLAQRMGAQIIVVHPSSEPIADEARAARMEQAKRSVRTMADMASQAGCRIALELLPRTCLGHSVEELLSLLEGVDAGTAGVCLDTNHLMADFAALPDVVRSLGPRLIALHCSDYDGVDERHWPPLRGVIDWAAFLSALRDVHFPGPLNYEAALDGQTPAERLAFLEENYTQLVSGTWSMRLKPFDNDTLGISGVVPEGWESGQPGEVARRASPADPTVLFQRGWAEVAIQELKLGVPPLLGLESFPPHVGTRETGLLAWNLYAGERELPETGTIRVDIALAQAGGWSFVVGLVAQGDEAEALHESVFLPAVDALTSPFADPALVNEIERHQAEHDRLVRAARKILRHGNWPDFAAIADQNRGILAPPPQKPYDEGSEVIELPQPDRSVLEQTHIFDLIRDRKSRRAFTAESLTLGELAYLLWATQGVREVFPGNVGSYRTVPSGGARHPFETYLAVSRVDGLAPGVYRYQPFQHQLVFLFPAQDPSHKLEALTTNRRSWVEQAAVCFVWSVVPYRAEWRYGLGARKDILIEAGHVCQNLYLACESIRCGTCAILGYHQDAIDAFLGLDGEDEMVIYLAPVGKVEP